MIRQWYEPFNFSEWFRRAFSFLNIAVFLMTAVFIISEFRFDWVEKMVGSYLTSTNDSRPETGAIWETGKQTTNAQASLSKIISKKEDTRKNVQQASSFADLASILLPGEWVTLEKQQFKSLYLSLEKPTALNLIEPAQLIWLLNGSSLERIFCEGIKGGVRLYFIDAENRVIKQFVLEKKEILEIENGVTPVPGTLNEMNGFQGRIYPAENFFNALFKLPTDIIPDLMKDPETLLKQDGRITKMGIWNEAENGYIKLGFEFETKDGRQVVFINGREWAVWQLSLILRGTEN